MRNLMDPVKSPAVPVRLTVGPAILVLAGLIDLYLISRVFAVATDPLVAVLGCFIFGALVGAPLQNYLAHTAVGRAMDSQSQPLYRRARTKAPMVAGVLSVISTIAGLYCLRVADASIILPLANLTPLFIGLLEGAQGRLSLRSASIPLALFFTGLYAFGSPRDDGGIGLTWLVFLLLAARNIASAGAEIAEKHGAFGSASQFSALRFGWFAMTGIPVAFTILVMTNQVGQCLMLILEVLPVALPLHLLAMLLRFFGSVLRTQSKAIYPLTTCSAVYVTPRVLVPLTAAGVNQFTFEFFPTVTGSLRLTVAAILVLTAAMWLSALRSVPQTPTNPLRHLRRV